MRSHWVIIPPDLEQRTTFDDALIAKDMGEQMITYLKSMKYRDVHKPYHEYFFYKNFMLVVHGNILSYYDVNEEKFITHHMFEDKGDEISGEISVNLD